MVRKPKTTKLVQNPHNLPTYLGNALVKKHGVAQPWTQWELDEYRKCKNDLTYFCETYVKVIHPDKGLVPFKLYPYQKKMIKHFDKNRHSIVLACRQSGKSISSCAYLLHFALFNSEKTLAILANKGSTSKEMLGRITLMLENLPFFLQPGCKALNKGSIHFSNNTVIGAHSTSGSSIRGLSISLLYLDEFAFVVNDGEFYTSTYPVIAAGKKTKIIITSTANGVNNMFYKLYEGAVQKTNEFQPYRVDWWDVPGRDEAWKKETIANTSQKQFEQEFGNSFQNTSSTLINGEYLLKLQAAEPVKVAGDVTAYELPKEGHVYTMSVDTSRGRGQDYSTFSIVDVTEVPFKQVCVYRDNEISPMVFPDIVHKFAQHYNNAFLIIESNDLGATVFKALFYDHEYENMYMGAIKKGVSFGLEMNQKVKRLGCSHLKDLVEQGKIHITDPETIKELCVFEVKKNSYQAKDGFHDDMVMTLVMFAWFVETAAFGEINTNGLRSLMSAEKTRLIDESIPSFGIITNSGQSEFELNDARKDMGYKVDEDFGWVTQDVSFGF